LFGGDLGGGELRLLIENKGDPGFNLTLYKRLRL